MTSTTRIGSELFKLLAAITALALLATLVRLPVASASSPEPDTVWYTHAPVPPVYQIGTADELAGLAQLVNAENDFSGTTIELSNDLDLSNYNWTPIGALNAPFKGTFDGKGHIISGLTINESQDLPQAAASKLVGLFGLLGPGSAVQNVALSGVNINVVYTNASTAGTAFVGALAGMNEGTVTSIQVSGTVSATSGDLAVGGLVGTNGSNRGSGSNQGGIVSQSSGAVSIQGSNSYQVLHVGGLVGDSTSSGSAITDSLSQGTVSANGAAIVGLDNNSSPTVGGLVGYTSNATISGSWSSAEVTALEGRSGSYAGGLAGHIVTSVVENSYATGNVYLRLRDNAPSGSATAGAGGLVGYMLFAPARISDSYSTGNVSIEAHSAALIAAGGLLGHSSGFTASVLVERSYATGNASAVKTDNGQVYAGGLAGMLWAASVDQSFSTGDAYSRSSAAQGNSGAGGLAGRLLGRSATATSDVKDSYSRGRAKVDSVYWERVGGLIGSIGTDSNVVRSYSTGIPTAVQGSAAQIGGAIGANGGSPAVNTFYDTSTSNQTDDLKGLPLNTGEMTEPNVLDAAQSGSMSGLSGGVWLKRPHATDIDGRIAEVYYPELAAFADPSASASAQAVSKASVTTAVYASLTHEGVTTYFGSIQGAVDAAADGDTVSIAPGVFKEQLNIAKNITLEGAGIDQTVLASPDSDKLLPSAWRNLKDQHIYAVVGVKTGSPGQVVIRNLTIDGLKQGYLPQHGGNSDLYTFSGIAVRDTSATIDRVKIIDVRDTYSDYSGVVAPLPSDYAPQDQPSGANHNESILLEGAAGTGAHQVTVQDSVILRFHKSGILAWGPALEVDIRSNTIQGHGRTLYSTGNGIQIASSDRSAIGGGNGDRRGTSGIVRNNQITDLGLVIPEPGQTGSYLNLGLYGPSGILLWEAADGFILEGNTITGPSVPSWHNSTTSNDGGYSNDGIGLNYSKNVAIRNNVIAGFGTAILEGSSVAGSSLNVSDNTLSGNGIDIWPSSGADTIKLGAGAETIAYRENGNGTDMIEGFGPGDRLRVIGFRTGSVNGQIGTSGNAVYVSDTGGAPVINGYTDGGPVVDFTGGTITSGDGTLVAARSVQVAVSGNVTTLYIDTENDADAPELEIKLAGVYQPLNFKLNGGDIEYFDPGAAPALIVASLDPSGASNDGKTQLTVTPAVTDAGHKLVYFNFGSGTVSIPFIGQVLTGYLDLPPNGLVAAANGDKIGVAEVDADGKVVKFGQAVALVTAEPSTGTPSAPSSGSPGGGTPAAEEESFVVLVNGKQESAGKAVTTESGGVKTTTIFVDTVKLLEKLRTAGDRAVVTIPVGVSANVIVAELDSQVIVDMARASATLVVRTPQASYTLPADQLGIEALSARLGAGVRSDNVKVRITIAEASASTASTVAAAAAAGGFTVVTTPLDFTVSATYGGRTVELSKFGKFVERTVALPNGLDSDKMTTGIVIEADGSFRHVPTKIVVIDGTYHAAINSLTNSVYSVVWHPVKFADAERHWAKDAINDMGARMVINGVTGTKFDPSAAITRAEFAAMIVRGLGLKPGEGEQTFPDVADGSWYAGIVRTATSYGLIQGFNGTFRPNDKITREEAMKIAAKAMELTGLAGKVGSSDAVAALSKFADGADIAVWAREAIALTAQAELITGRSGGRLEPKANISRAEVAVLIQRLLQRSELI